MIVLSVLAITYFVTPLLLGFVILSALIHIVDSIVKILVEGVRR